MEDAEEIRSIDLRDGRRLVVRPVRAEDLDAVRSLYERLSPEDLQFRFFASRVPPDPTIGYWISSADRGGLVVVVEVVEGGAGALVVAEAGYALLDDGDGEVAITVDPAWRGWLGPWLLDVVAERAAADGVANLQADVLVHNRNMRAVLGHRGYAVVDHPDWHEIRLVISTTGRTPSWPSHGPRPRLLIRADGSRWELEQEAQAAGFDVRTCPGPSGPLAHCPVRDGRPCPLVEGADALVIALASHDPQTDELVAAHRARHPDLPIVLPRPTGGAVVPEPCGCASYLIDQIRAQLAARTVEGDGDD